MSGAANRRGGSRVSAAMRRALAALSTSVLRQLADIGAPMRTLSALCARGLARRIDLKPPTIYRTEYHTFYLLTPAGAALVAAS